MAFSNLSAPLAVQPALSHNVVDVLREMISRGQLEQGEHLKEAEIATALGISRGPVREAFSQLANEGYIELRRHRGAFVVTLTRQDIHEVYSLRLALERLAIERASTRMTPERFAEMDSILKQIQNIDEQYSPDEAVQLDLAFHDLLYVAAEHQRLQRSWEFIRSQVEFFLHARNVSHRDFLEVGYPEHKQLRDVLATGDPVKAAALIEEHLSGAYSRLLDDHPEDSESTDRNSPAQLGG